MTCARAMGVDSGLTSSSAPEAVSVLNLTLDVFPQFLCDIAAANVELIREYISAS